MGVGTSQDHFVDGGTGINAEPVAALVPLQTTRRSHQRSKKSPRPADAPQDSPLAQPPNQPQHSTRTNRGTGTYKDGPARERTQPVSTSVTGASRRKSRHKRLQCSISDTSGKLVVRIDDKVRYVCVVKAAGKRKAFLIKEVRSRDSNSRKKKKVKKQHRFDNPTEAQARKRDDWQLWEKAMEREKQQLRDEGTYAESYIPHSLSVTS